MQQHRQHGFFFHRKRVKARRFKVGHRRMIRPLVYQVVNVALNLAMYGRSVELRLRPADLHLPAVYIRMNLAVERIVAQKAVEIRRRRFLRRPGQAMHAARERCKQLVGLFRMHAVTQLVQRAAQ